MIDNCHQSLLIVTCNIICLYKMQNASVCSVVDSFQSHISKLEEKLNQIHKSTANYKEQGRISCFKNFSFIPNPFAILQNVFKRVDNFWHIQENVM